MVHVTDHTLEPPNTIPQVVVLYLRRNNTSRSRSRSRSPFGPRLKIPPGCVATAAVALPIDGDAGHSGLDAVCAVRTGFIASHLALATELAAQPWNVCVAALLAPGSGCFLCGLRHQSASKGSQGWAWLLSRDMAR